MVVNFINTEVMCMVAIVEDGEPHSIDLGNYFTLKDEKVLITTNKLAVKYGHLVKVPIYTRKDANE